MVSVDTDISTFSVWLLFVSLSHFPKLAPTLFVCHFPKIPCVYVFTQQTHLSCFFSFFAVSVLCACGCCGCSAPHPWLPLPPARCIPPPRTDSSRAPPRSPAPAPPSARAHPAPASLHDPASFSPHLPRTHQPARVPPPGTATPAAGTPRRRRPPPVRPARSGRRTATCRSCRRASNALSLRSLSSSCPHSAVLKRKASHRAHQVRVPRLRPAVPCHPPSPSLPAPLQVRVRLLLGAFC